MTGSRSLRGPAQRVRPILVWRPKARPSDSVGPLREYQGARLVCPALVTAAQGGARSAPPAYPDTPPAGGAYMCARPSTSAMPAGA